MCYSSAWNAPCSGATLDVVATHINVSLRCTINRAMKVLVKLFASYREAAGVSEEVIEIPDDSTVGEVIEAIVAKYPGLEDMSSAIRALNQKVVDPDAKVNDGDTLAIFPQVGGG